MAKKEENNLRKFTSIAQVAKRFRFIRDNPFLPPRRQLVVGGFCEVVDAFKVPENFFGHAATGGCPSDTVKNRGKRFGVSESVQTLVLELPA